MNSLQASNIEMRILPEIIGVISVIHPTSLIPQKQQNTGAHMLPQCFPPLNISFL